VNNYDEYTTRWVKMLTTINSVTEEKAIAIVKVYPTIKSLIDDYLKNSYNKKK
jgi:hypothetical protein